MYSATPKEENNETNDKNTNDTNNQTDVNTSTNTDSSDTQQIDWKSAIDETYRTHLGEDIKDLNSLAKQYVEQQKFLGQSIRIPGEDASDEARKEFAEKIQKHAPNLISRPDPTNEEATKEFWEMAGVPKEPDGYRLSEVPEGLSEDDIKEVREFAHRYGLTNQGFEQFVKDQYQQNVETKEASKQAQEQSLKELQSEWGMATEGKMNDVKKFATDMGFPQDFIEALNNNNVSKEWYKVVDNVIQQFGGMKEGSEAAFQRGQNLPDTPAELEQKIIDIETNPAYRDVQNPNHRNLIAKRIQLLKDLDKSKHIR